MGQELITKKIDDAATMWNKTKDPQYKDLWYKLIKEYVDGPHNIKRRVVPISTSVKADDGRYDVIRPAKFFRPLRHHKIKINNVS